MRVILQPQVVQHVSTSIQHGAGVGPVLPTQSGACVPCSRLKYCVPWSNIRAGYNTRASYQTAYEVAHDGPVQIGQDHHIKLPGVGDQLHTTVVDDHLLVLNVWVILGHSLAHLQEQAVSHLHDVCFVNQCNFSSLVISG